MHHTARSCPIWPLPSVLLCWYGMSQALDDETVHEAGGQNVLAEALLLQQLERTERRARVTGDSISSASISARTSRVRGGCL